MITHQRALALAVVSFTLAGCSGTKNPPPPPATTESPAGAPATERVVGPLSEADAAALASMNSRLKDYVELHNKLERELPKLPDNATPTQIDTNQRLLEDKVRAARAGAKQGDLFTPEATPVIKRLLEPVCWEV